MQPANAASKLTAENKRRFVTQVCFDYFLGVSQSNQTGNMGDGELNHLNTD
jgi:hypothetical protein